MFIISSKLLASEVPGQLECGLAHVRVFIRVPFNGQPVRLRRAEHALGLDHGGDEEKLAISGVASPPFFQGMGANMARSTYCEFIGTLSDACHFGVPAIPVNGWPDTRAL